VSPRAYRMVRVKLPLPRPRARILDAARQLLANESETDLGMEAIARRAEGSRLTLCYQFMAADVVSMLSG
jgi:AcrR family transcriptional regulator